MFRAKSLHRRAVVDLDAGKKIGDVADLVLDSDGQRVAGYLVAQGPAVLGRGEHAMIPAAAVHAVGPDAITVRRGETTDGTGLGELPRLSHLTGRRIVSTGGKVLGAIRDVLVEDDGARIAAYELEAAGPAGRLGGLAGHEGAEARYVRAGSNFRVGPDAVVVPEDAVVERIGHGTDAAGRHESAGAADREVPARHADVGAAPGGKIEIPEPEMRPKG